MYVCFQTFNQTPNYVMLQGSNLGLILHIIDINNISTNSEKLFSILYANDTSVLLWDMSMIS